VLHLQSSLSLLRLSRSLPSLYVTRAQSWESITKINQPTSLKAPFLEQFTDDWEDRWRVSHAKKEKTEEEWQYVGTWSVEEPTVLRAIGGDKGLVLKDKAAHHAISAKFPKAIDNKDKTLVVQYEAKFQGRLFSRKEIMRPIADSEQAVSSVVVLT